MITAWESFAREEIARANQRAQESEELARIFDFLAHEERTKQETEREKRALEWAISTGAKP